MWSYTASLSVMVVSSASVACCAMIETEALRAPVFRERFDEGRGRSRSSPVLGLGPLHDSETKTSTKIQGAKHVDASPPLPSVGGTVPAECACGRRLRIGGSVCCVHRWTWRKRYFVMHGGEIQYLDAAGGTQKGALTLGEGGWLGRLTGLALIRPSGQRHTARAVRARAPRWSVQVPYCSLPRRRLPLVFLPRAGSAVEDSTKSTHAFLIKATGGRNLLCAGYTAEDKVRWMQALRRGCAWAEAADKVRKRPSIK